MGKNLRGSQSSSEITEGQGSQSSSEITEGQGSQSSRRAGISFYRSSSQINRSSSQITEEQGSRSSSQINRSSSQINERQGSRSGSKINEGQIITQGQLEIITQDFDSQISTEDADSDFVTQDTVSQIVFDSFNEDGILSLILSSMSLKEAVRSCILSHRWKHIWTCLPTLNFILENILDDETLELYKNFRTGKDKCLLLMGKTDYFIQTVNSVMQQYQGHVRVDTITIRYFLHKAHSHYLDAWVRFAVATKAKRFYLHLRQPHSNFRNVELYDFPLHWLDSSSIEELYLVSCTLKLSDQLDYLNRLVVLAMWDMGNTGEEINHLVSHCSSLVRLDVMGSKDIVSLSIPRSLSQLHSLTVENCDCLTEIKVKAENVDEFLYEGVPMDFAFRQPSNLVKARICFKTEGSDHNLNFYFTKLAKDMPYIRFLILKIDGVLKVENLPKCSPSFIHLKRLNWEWSKDVKMSHLHLDTLFDAAPFLEELQLCLSTYGVKEPPPRLTMLKKKMRKKLPKHPHPHLKIIEISGFSFVRWQVEIVLYLIINAAKLDSITLTLEKGSKPPEKISETDMKSLALQVPKNVKLVIL